MKKTMLSIIIILLIIAAVVTFVVFYKPPAERLRLKFLAECKAGQLDTKVYITALKTGSSMECDTIKDKNAAIFCKAEVTKNKELCNQLTISGMTQYCNIIVAKDKTACGNNYECIAYTTGDASYCDKVDRANMNECKAVVTLNPAILEDNCEELANTVFKKV